MSDKVKAMLMVLMLSSLVSGCASRAQSNYYADEVGTPMSVEDVWIVSSRMVKIEGLASNARPGWGAAAGATLAGATAYGITEANNPAGVAITIVALLGGAITGQFFDEKIKSELGVEYILDRPTADKIAVVQAVQHVDERLESNMGALLIRGQNGFYRVVPQ